MVPKSELRVPVTLRHLCKLDRLRRAAALETGVLPFRCVRWRGNVNTVSVGGVDSLNYFAVRSRSGAERSRRRGRGLRRTLL
jgi:hypothetical protein